MFTPSGAIFDLDGTLFDSMWIWKKLDAEFLARHGHIATPDYTDAIKAMGWAEGAQYTIDRYHLPLTTEEVIQMWFDMSEEYYRTKVKMKPYAKEYLLALHEAGIPLAVATAMEPQTNIDVVLSANGLTGLFQNITVGTDVARGKGHADIYLLAAERMGIPPSECAVYEDLLTAIRGAAKGGFQTVAIFDSISENEWPDMEIEATRAVRSWKELLV